MHLADKSNGRQRGAVNPPANEVPTIRLDRLKNAVDYGAATARANSWKHTRAPGQ